MKQKIVLFECVHCVLHFLFPNFFVRCKKRRREDGFLEAQPRWVRWYRFYYVFSVYARQKKEETCEDNIKYFETEYSKKKNADDWDHLWFAVEYPSRFHLIFLSFVDGSSTYAKKNIIISNIWWSSIAWILIGVLNSPSEIFNVLPVTCSNSHRENWVIQSESFISAGLILTAVSCCATVSMRIWFTQFIHFYEFVEKQFNSLWKLLSQDSFYNLFVFTDWFIH